MESALRQKSLPMTIFPDCELFVRLTPEFCLNVANRLRTIIRRLKHCVKRQNKEHMTHVLRILFAPGTRYYEDDPILNLSATTP